MRQFILILILGFFLLACDQNKNKQKDIGLKENKISIDSANSKVNKIADTSSAAIGNFIVIVDKSYFFNAPDLETKRKYDYLVKNDLILVQQKTSDFAYTNYTSASGNQMMGWILLSDLKQVFFTPPKAIKN